MHRAVPLALLLALALGAQVNAQDLAGRYTLSGEDASGAYGGTVELYTDGDGYRIVRDARRQRAFGQLGKGATQQWIETTGSTKTYKHRVCWSKIGVVPGGLQFEVKKARMSAFLIYVDGVRSWVKKKKVKKLPARFVFTASLKQLRGASDALSNALEGAASTGGTLSGTFEPSDEDSSIVGNWGDGSSERWKRIPDSADTPAPLRFVLSGTDLPLADSTIEVGHLLTDGSFEPLLAAETDGEGYATFDLSGISGSVDVVFSRDGLRRTRTEDQVDTLDVDAFQPYSTLALNYHGPRWEDVCAKMRKVPLSTGKGKFSWNGATWDVPLLDCITSALYTTVEATEMGPKGTFHAPSLENMVRTHDDKPFVANSAFRGVLQPAFGTDETMRRLAGAGSVYRGVCKWPWADMEWGWGGESECGCGAHATPASIVRNRDRLGRINILSLSQAKRPKGPDHGPMTGWQMKYEYSVLLLIKRSDGSLYTYHSGSLKTFKAEVDNWAHDSSGSRQTDVRYLVWRVDDAQINPFFFLDKNGAEWTPREVRKTVVEDTNTIADHRP